MSEKNTGNNRQDFGMIMKCLTEKQLTDYKRDGYVILNLLKEAEVDNLSRDYDNIFARQFKDNNEATWDGDWNKNKGETKVYSIHGLQLYSSTFTRLLMNEKLLDACEDILGTEDIVLHHTKAHFKPPGAGSPFPMHQDYHYFPRDKDTMVAVFLTLDDAEPENGGLCVYPGSHKLGPQKDCSSKHLVHYLDQNKFPIEKATPVSLKKGQILIFSYLLIHGSYNNTSNQNRRMFLMQVHAGDSVPITSEDTRPCMGMVLRGERSCDAALWQPMLLEKKRKHEETI